MSDFIFSKKKRQKGILTNALEFIYDGYSNSIKEIHCEFGSLAFVKNHYNGFNIYQDSTFICLVIGGPVLNFRDNNFIANEDSNEGTKSIFDRWIINKEIVWDEDLSGPFVVFCLSKETGEMKLVTDMMSFIPVYSNKEDKNLLIGTHIDSLNNTKGSELDEVSVVDFLLNEVVTFPHTFWKEYNQLYPGTTYEWKTNNDKIECQSESYWLPKEPENQNIDLNVLAGELRNGLKDYVGRVSKSAKNVASFISGGEDSRSVLSLIVGEKDALIFIDSENRESSIARKVCNNLDVNIIIQEREKNYYLNILEKASSLIGSGFDFAHVHTVGFIERGNMLAYNAIFGGFLADTLLKGHHIKKKQQYRLFRFVPLPEKIDSDYSGSIPDSNVFENVILEKVKKRRARHQSWIRDLRCNSYKEWLNIYPITMHNDIPNILGNRRLFCSYEPFTCNKVVKIASLASQKQKLDRKLFQTALKPIFKKTKWIRHANGSFPFLPWYLNNLFMYQRSLIKRLGRLLKKNQSNESSWANWEKIIYSEKAFSLEKKYFSGLKKRIGHLFDSNLESGILKETSISVRQKRILLQLGYILQEEERVNENS